jgi:hypothetical protein
MEHSYIAKLPKNKQEELLHDLNYLNLSEIKSFCKRHSIPFRIAVKIKDGKKKWTSEDDRKGVILDRIRQFLQTGVIPRETCFTAEVVRFAPLPETLGEKDRLYFGQYNKFSQTMNTLLKSLTGGKFKNGAIARIIAREFWSRGTAPTFAEFAAAWVKSSKQHTRPNPEWAFLSDRANGENVQNWKSLRNRKALEVLGTLNRLLAVPRTSLPDRAPLSHSLQQSRR